MPPPPPEANKPAMSFSSIDMGNLSTPEPVFAIAMAALCAKALYCAAQVAVLTTLCVWMRTFRLTFPPDSDDFSCAAAMFAFLVMGCVTSGCWAVWYLWMMSTCRPTTALSSSSWPWTRPWTSWRAGVVVLESS